MDSQGLRTVQSKVDFVKQFPQTSSVEKVRSFLGLCGYYRESIKNYADIAQPLSSLLKKNTASSWSPSQIKPFDTERKAHEFASINFPRLHKGIPIVYRCLWCRTGRNINAGKKQ